jgi:hypothetical protein
MISQTFRQSSLNKFITKHSEYLFEGDRCLSVYQSKAEQPGHVALHQRLVAAVRWVRGGGHEVLPGQWPIVGDSLLLGEDGRALLTSAVLRIETVVSGTAE